jgi:ElaB/YqjD/DUF883 family membrane-anchored ribosome-binding protein
MFTSAARGESRSAGNRISDSSDREHFVAGTSLEVRRHPLAAVGIAATAGIAAGCVFGLTAAWFWRRRG